MADTDWDGAKFYVTLADTMACKSELVEGRYFLPALREGAAVAVKVIDLPDEEAVVTATA